MKRLRISYSIVFLFLLNALFAQEEQDSFKFGGFVKTDFMSSWYKNGPVTSTSSLRDFYSPGQIPTGPSDDYYDFGAHMKETRFNFEVSEMVMGKPVKAFLEFDFMLSPGGNEKVSNSYSPRVRHAYVEWGKFMIGQNWSTFMIATLPDDIDFVGAMDGIVFVRQPQLRIKHGSWWFSIENPETLYFPYASTSTEVSELEIVPDLVVRKNFDGEWGNWSIAGIGRVLHAKDSVSHAAVGYGFTTGGQIKVGNTGDDIRMVGTFGSGLGRYLAAAFLPSAYKDASGDLNTITTLNAYLAYNHYWKSNLSSSLDGAVYYTFEDDDLVPTTMAKKSYSLSANLKWYPISSLMIGLEYMHGCKTLYNDDMGAFQRMQFSVKYAFQYKHSFE